MAKNNTATTMTKDKLDERYINFCEKHDLDFTIPAEEQVELTTPQQMWMDRHLTNINKAVNAGFYMTVEEAELEEAEQATQVALSESASENEVMTPAVAKKSRIERYKDNMIGMLNLVDVARKTAIAVCPEPSAIKNSKRTKSGEIQLGLAF